MQLHQIQLYVVYTGNRKTKPETISLKRSFWNTDNCCVEVEAKVIYDSQAGDILNQFIVFSKVFDEQRKQWPDDMRKAVQETIRICIERDVLNEYLAGEEAATVMFAFADQEREFSRALKTERREGEARGISTGKILGTVETMRGDGKTDRDIIVRLMTKYNLTREEAEGYVLSSVMA